MTFNDIYTQAQQLASALDSSKLKDKRDGVFVVELTGTNGGTMTAEIKDGRITLEPVGRSKCTASASLSMDDCEAMLAGRLNPLTALTAGRIKLKGNVLAVMAYKSLFM